MRYVRKLSFELLFAVGFANSFCYIIDLWHFPGSLEVFIDIGKYYVKLEGGRIFNTEVGGLWMFPKDG